MTTNISDAVRHLYAPLWGLFIMTVLIIFYFAQSILVPIFLAILFALLFNPTVTLLSKTGLARAISSALIIVITTSTLILLLSYLSEPTRVWFDRLPTEIKLIEKKIASFKDSIETVQKTTENISDITEISASNKSDSNVVVEGPNIFSQLLESTQSFMISVLIFLTLLYFLLAFGPDLANTTSQFWAKKGHQNSLMRLFSDAQQQISRYLLSITIINISLGVIVATAMYFLDMPNPILWGASAALLNFIPYVGPAINLVVVSFVSLLTFDSTLTVLLPPLILLSLNIIEGQIVQPLFLGRMLTVNPIIVFLFILFWGALWGIAGIFMAVPILVIVKIALNPRNPKLSNQQA